MCCLFGFVDYAGFLSVKQRNRLIRELSIAAEARGTDATGIAYNTSRGLQIYKRPLAAHVQYRLGHKNIQVTMQIYQHLTNKISTENAQLLELF